MAQVAPKHTREVTLSSIVFPHCTTVRERALIMSSHSTLKTGGAADEVEDWLQVQSQEGGGGLEHAEFAGADHDTETLGQ